jgi:hypothetical protein
MTALKLFSIAANGTPMGIFAGIDEDAAVLAYAQAAGYKTIADAAAVFDEKVEDWRAELDVEDLQETYENILDDIRDLAATVSDHNEKMLNIRRAELAEVAQKLVDGGRDTDYSADLDRALDGSHYRDTIYQDEAMIISKSDIADLGLLSAA